VERVAGGDDDEILFNNWALPQNGGVQHASRVRELI
jgi:hypothetical protein